VRAFSDSDDFALTGLVVTQQVGENPWHFCPSPQFVVTLEGSWYIRTSDGKTTTFRPGDVLYQVRRSVLVTSLRRVAVMASTTSHSSYAIDAARERHRRSKRRTTPRSTHWPNSERAAKPRAAPSTGAARTAGPAISSSSA